MAENQTKQFKDLHVAGDPFILANAWDLGSARVLAAMGAKALATTSAGHAFTLGRPDMGHVSRDEAIDHARQLAEATPLPVSGDLENGYGHDCDAVVETVKTAAEAGLAGCSIEDTSLPGVEPYSFQAAVERVEAAISVAKSKDPDFVITARADGVMNGQYDVAEAKRRLLEYDRLGAHVVYAPVLPDMTVVADICKSVDAAVNVLCVGNFTGYPLETYRSAGVARISLGSALARVTHRVLFDSAVEMFEKGEFSSLSNGISGGRIDKLLNLGNPA